MSAITHTDLNKLSHDEIKKLINIFKNDPYNEAVEVKPHYMTNRKTLKDLLNNYDYKSSEGLTYDVIYKAFMPNTPEPTGLEPKVEDENHKDDEVDERPQGLSSESEPEEAQSAAVEDLLYFPERRFYDDDINNVYEDELQQLLEYREAIDSKIKELQQREQENKEFIDSLMNIPASESPIQKSHEERYKAHAEEATDGILNGDINRDLNKELTKYVDKHPLLHLECDDAVLLFPPMNIEAFKRELRRVVYRPNTIKKEDHNIYINYFLNRITEINFIFSSLDQIYEENKARPIKISFDCGFVIEDTQNTTYKRTAPIDEETGRTVPVIIKNKEDMETYKHYVFSAISEKAEKTHETSSQRFCAIHTMLFKITKLGLSGAKVSVPGYDFLAKSRYIRVSPNKYNLCMFCAILD